MRSLRCMGLRVCIALLGQVPAVNDIARFRPLFFSHRWVSAVQYLLYILPPPSILLALPLLISSLPPSQLLHLSPHTPPLPSHHAHLALSLLPFISHFPRTHRLPRSKKKPTELLCHARYELLHFVIASPLSVPRRTPKHVKLTRAFLSWDILGAGGSHSALTCLFPSLSVRV